MSAGLKKKPKTSANLLEITSKLNSAERISTLIEFTDREAAENWNISILKVDFLTFVQGFWKSFAGYYSQLSVLSVKCPKIAIFQKLCTHFRLSVRTLKCESTVYWRQKKSFCDQQSLRARVPPPHPRADLRRIPNLFSDAALVTLLVGYPYYNFLF